MRPQLRQWCFRLKVVNASRQRRQTSESIHSGAIDVSVIASVASARSFGGNTKPATGNVSAASTNVEERNGQTFFLKGSVYCIDIQELRFAFECDCPILDVAEDAVLDVDIEALVEGKNR